MARTKTRAKSVKRILNCEPSRETERDWRFKHADQAGLLAAAPKAIPSSKDLRATWWKIGNQGSSGSCVGWATADSVLRWHFTKAGRLKSNEKLAPRFIWMASKETDKFISQPTTFIEIAGTSLKSALDVARKFGAVREFVLPFSGKLFAGEEESFYARAAERKISSYFNLTLGAGSDIDDWRRWIATKGPILTRLDVDRTWDEADSTGGNLDTYRPNTARGGHAVALVGYTPDRFVVRNSWGTGWGDGGFAYASLAYAQDAFTEAYGVSL
jgi:hypothetical protein